MHTPAIPAAPAATLNIIGAGRLGRTLGRLWADSGAFSIHDIFCRTEESAQAAMAFIGAGRPASQLRMLRPAAVTLIATPDDQIATTCDQLAAAGLLSTNSIVMHCSGALASSALRGASRLGAAVASIHPVRSFADPATTAATFAGTWCGMEGDAAAIVVLEPAFQRIGARLATIAATDKTLYHAAAVFASNYLVTVLDVALETYVRAGIPRDTALSMMAPLARGAVENVLTLGPEQALTGPLQRGDFATVEKHYQALRGWNPRVATLYRKLAQRTLALVRRHRL